MNFIMLYVHLVSLLEDFEDDYSIYYDFYDDFYNLLEFYHNSFHKLVNGLNYVYHDDNMFYSSSDETNVISFFLFIIYSKLSFSIHLNKYIYNFHTTILILPMNLSEYYYYIYHINNHIRLHNYMKYYFLFLINKFYKK